MRYNIKEKNPNWKGGISLNEEYGKKWRRNNKNKCYLYGKKWRRNNKNKCCLYTRKYYYKNKDKELEKAKEYYYKNKDKELEKAKEYYYKNRDKELERMKKWRKKNRDYLKGYQKEYYKRPKTKLLIKAKDHRRNTLKKYKIGDITVNQIKQIFKRDKVCIYCGSDKRLELDHIIPISHEIGNSLFYNYVVSCRSCNSSKKDKNIFIWCKKQKIEIPKIVIENLEKLFKELNNQKKLIIPPPSSTQQNFLFCFSFLAFVVEIKNNIKQNCVGK